VLRRLRNKEKERYVNLDQRYSQAGASNKFSILVWISLAGGEISNKKDAAETGG
jgi:hypothetical protein